MKTQKNLLFSFEDLANAKDKATKAVARHFTQAGAPVVGVEADAKTKRSSGISYREIHFTFADSQKVTLRVKQTGDVFEVLLNGGVMPIKNQDNHIKAIAEIAALMDKGRGAFQKKLVAAAVKPPPGIKTAAPKLKQALIEKLAALNEAIAAVDGEIAGLRAKMAA